MDGDPGRHERLVTVGDLGNKEGLHKNDDALIFVP